MTQVSLTPALRTVLAAALLLAGCAKRPDDRALFMQVKPLSDAVLADPKGASAEQVEQAVNALEAVAEQVPGRYGGGKAEEALGLIFLGRGEPAKARDHFTHVFWYYHPYPDLALMALIHIARTYEAEQNWKAAEQGYKVLDNHYGWSPVWMEAPLYPGQMYERHGYREQAVVEYERAVSMLRYRAAMAPNLALEAKTRMHLATAYEALGQWQQAAATLEALAASQKPEVDRAAVLIQLAECYAAPGRDLAKAEAVVRRLLQEFPNHPKVREAKARLAQLTRSSP